MEIEGTFASKNFDETVASSPRKDKSGFEKDYKGFTESSSSASRLASSSTGSFLGKNECPRTRCSLIELEKEDSSCQICHRVSGKRKDGGEDRVARTERESDRRRKEEKWQICWCCRDQQKACRMALATAEKLERTGLAEKE